MGKIGFKPEEEILTKVKKEEVKQIVLYNDDVNSFDWVIQSLIEVCKTSVEAANQISLLVHYKGKCDVKHGSYEELKPICTELLRRQLNAEIE